MRHDPGSSRETFETKIPVLVVAEGAGNSPLQPGVRARVEGGTMWKWTPKDGNKPVEGSYPEATHIGKSIVIKGEVSGSENVYVAGELEGNIELLDGSLTVGPEGRIRANVQARSIVVHGRVDGNLYGTKRVDLKKSAVLVGDICTPRIAIEEGASLKGSVLVQKDIPTLQAKKADGAAAPK
jgi:cytoskeletal protein CcmA (bactofilin family)